MAWDRLSGSYDAVAETYEAAFVDELAGKPRDRELLEALAGSVADPVVDLGCGPGQIGIALRERGRHVVGVDLSRAMARLADARLDSALVADLRALPLGSATVGALVAFYAVIHLPRSDLVAALVEFARVLRPGGRLLLSAHEGEGRIEQSSFLDQPVPFVATLFSLDEVVMAVEAAGLTATLAERRRPYPREHPTVRLYVGAVRPV
jgi:SAM-dependent methyltransferase